MGHNRVLRTSSTAPGFITRDISYSKGLCRYRDLDEKTFIPRKAHPTIDNGRSDDKMMGVSELLTLCSGTPLAIRLMWLGEIVRILDHCQHETGAHTKSNSSFGKGRGSRLRKREGIEYGPGKEEVG